MGYGRLTGSTGYAVGFTPVATGDPNDWDDAAAGAGVEALGDGAASEKAAGMLNAGGRLWYWIRNISSVGTGIRHKSSADYGSTNPQPWGPWQTVFSSGSSTWPGGTGTETCGLTNWGSGERADIPSKHMSADGKTFCLFSSGGDCLSIAPGVLP